jgi:hypothetical protein
MILRIKKAATINMKTIQIPDETYDEVQKLITDIPELGYKTVDDYCLRVINGTMAVVRKMAKKAHKG